MTEIQKLRVLLFEAIHIMDDHAPDCKDKSDLGNPCDCGRNDFVDRAMEMLIPYCKVCGDVAISGYDYCPQHFKTTSQEIMECFPRHMRGKPENDA